jgi:hypothetical protein
MRVIVVLIIPLFGGPTLQGLTSIGPLIKKGFRHLQTRNRRQGLRPLPVAWLAASGTPSKSLGYHEPQGLGRPLPLAPIIEQ